MVLLVLSLIVVLSTIIGADCKSFDGKWWPAAEIHDEDFRPLKCTKYTLILNSTQLCTCEGQLKTVATISTESSEQLPQQLRVFVANDYDEVNSLTKKCGGDYVCSQVELAWRFVADNYAVIYSAPKIALILARKIESTEQVERFVDGLAEFKNVSHRLVC